MIDGFDDETKTIIPPGNYTIKPTRVSAAGMVALEITEGPQKGKELFAHIRDLFGPKSQVTVKHMEYVCHGR